jgi:hypothetical protein
VPQDHRRDLRTSDSLTAWGGYATGDVADLDEAGHFGYVRRSKDIIRRLQVLELLRELHEAPFHPVELPADAADVNWGHHILSSAVDGNVEKLLDLGERGRGRATGDVVVVLGRNSSRG